MEYLRGVGELHGVLLCFTNEVDNVFIDLMVLLFYVKIIVLNTNKYIYTRGTCATLQSVYDIFSVFPPVSANLRVLIRFFVALQNYSQ